MTRNEIIALNPIEQVITAAGIELKRKGKELSACCPFHDDSTPSLSVNVDKGTWYCHGCGKGGGVIDFVMLSRGIDTAEAMRQLSRDAPQSPSKPPPAPAKPAAAKPPLTEVCHYDYEDALGNVVYRAIRYEPKTFKQCHWNGTGWVWGMEGVEKVLYHFPEVMAADRVFVCEGEKDADSVRALGYCATTNIGGSGAWLDGYAADLADKTAIVVPDNDDAGKKRTAAVIKSLEGNAKTLLITVPAPHKDITEYLDEFSTEDAGRAAVDVLVDHAQVFTQGLDLGIYSIYQLESQYRDFVRQAAGKELDVSLWLEGFRGDVRPMWPGETVAIVGDTGIGKTAIMQGIAMAAKHLPILVFELELSGEMMFERTASLTSGKGGRDIKEIYRLTSDRVALAGAEHIWTCPLSGLSVPEIAKKIERAELVMWKKPAVVCIDYIGLVKGIGKRYERVSDIAQDLKVLAKTSRTVIVEVSQIHRKPGQAGMPIGLHDAKDSGEVENSGGLVLGCWRDREDKNIGYVKVLKCTKGIAGRTVKVKIDFPRITQVEADYKIES